MQVIAMPRFNQADYLSPVVKPTRLESIDLLRGVVMIIMALDHVRHFFHTEAFLYEPTDLARTIVLLFFTRWITLFCLFRIFNIYGDAALWSTQKNAAFSLLSFLNVTKYPPSLLYSLITLGPAMIFLALAEKPLNSVSKKIIVFGRVPFFYYVVHIFLIHLLALAGAVLSGYTWSDMILSDKVNRVPALKGYGFNLLTVYLVWIGLIIILYPCCKCYERYKRTHQSSRWWLSYL